jgi:hypothetical protein
VNLHTTLRAEPRRGGTCCNRSRLSPKPGEKGAPSPTKAPIIVIARSKMASSCCSVGAAECAVAARKKKSQNRTCTSVERGIFQQLQHTSPPTATSLSKPMENEGAEARRLLLQSNGLIDELTSEVVHP